MKITMKIVSCHTADSKPFKQEVNSTREMLRVRVCFLPARMCTPSSPVRERERERERERGERERKIVRRGRGVEYGIYKRNDRCLGNLLVI